MDMFLLHLPPDHRLLALSKHSRKLYHPLRSVMVSTDMEILLHSKEVVHSKTRGTLGLGLTHGNDDFAIWLRIQAFRGARLFLELVLESVVSIMIRQILQIIVQSFFI